MHRLALNSNVEKNDLELLLLLPQSPDCLEYMGICRAAQFVGYRGWEPGLGV